MKTQPSEIVHTVRCASCGAIRQKVNNWWVISIASRRLELQPMKEFVDGGLYYLCGTECVTKLVGEFMDELTDEYNRDYDRKRKLVGGNDEGNGSKDVAS